MSSPAELPNATSSYSDPIYDRLELIAQQFRRRVALYLFAIVVIVVGFVVAHHLLQDTPLAGSAAAFLKVSEERDATKRTEGFQSLIDDKSIAPLFRARAALELAQVSLNANKLDDAKKHIATADDLSAGVENLDLSLAIQLSRGAVELQSGDAAKAQDTYSKVERNAGAKYPDRKLAAELGQALSLEKLGKIDEAITKLEPMINRTESAAKNLLDIARVQYWRLKRATNSKPIVNVPALPAIPAAPSLSDFPTTITK